MNDRASSPQESEPLRIDGVTIVDTSDGRLSPAMSVAIAGGLITEVGPAEDIAMDSPIRKIDAAGRFVVPGYNDMHVHSLHEPDPSGAFALMLANGITGMRQMMGSSELLRRRRAGTLPIGRDAPELLAMPGSILTPLSAATPEEAVETVRVQKRDGADFIKVILVPPSVLLPVLRAAVEAGLVVAGHLQNGVHPLTASRAGFRCIEHLGTGESVWVACSTDEEALNAEAVPPARMRLPPKVPFVSGLVEKAVMKRLRKLIVNPAAHIKPEEASTLKRALDTFSEAKCRELASELVADGTWQVPTLTRQRTQQLADEHDRDPNVRYVRPESLELWRRVTDDVFRPLPAAVLGTLRSAYEHELELTKIYDEAGTLMMTGSDETGGWDIAGFALHQEFDELAAAGLTPLRILQMTTALPARFLERTDTMGSVEVGKAANLVLLDGDPTVSVANLHRIHAVVRDGRYLSRGDLDGLLARVEAGAGVLQ